MSHIARAGRITPEELKAKLDRGYPMTSLATTTSAAPATTLAMATQGGSHA